MISLAALWLCLYLCPYKEVKSQDESRSTTSSLNFSTKILLRPVK
jgi:hypothetical protein